jgi:hypothetical protein
MLKEKKNRNLKTFSNSFSKGVSKMKPFRITVVLLALLVLPLFASQAWAQFSVTQLTEDFINPSTKVSANSDTLVMAFRIPASVSGETLTTVKVRSFIELGFATERVRLWAENGTTAGWQKTDEVLGTIITSSLAEGFQTNYVITFSGLNYELTSGDTFYVTLDMYNSYVNAHADTFHETGLEVVIDPGFIELKDGQVNINHVHNDGYFTGPPDGFSPFILYFDTKGPQFDLHFCIEDSACSNWAYYDIEPYVRVAMVNHDDSVRICATSVESDIDSAYGIHVIGNVHLLGYVSSMHMFGVSDIKLTCPNDDPWGCGGGGKQWCDSCWSRGFRIPEVNTSSFKGVDADTGHWAICAYARDIAGNVDTICIGHEELPHRIDTQDPIIDEITWELVNDWNGDGKIGLGDCIMIIAKGYSNPIEPLKECVQMRVDTSWMAGHSSSYPGGEWAVLSDTLQENNRIFRRVFCLTNPVNIDSTDCPVNFLVEAWDNACNHDTLRGEICGTIDLDPPIVDVLYEWHTDYDTMWACMSLGDKVFIEATVGGNDVVSVVAWMDSAGIDELMQHNMPLPNRGGGIYDTIWTITEPPIKYGKDRDNTQQPARDSIYRAWVVACDDVGNCDTAYGDLNKTLDTRRPRPIGYSQFCPDSVPCALVANSLAGGVIEVVWDTACDENDAYAFYVWALAPGETEFDSIGFTSVDEQPILAKYWSWHSEPLEEGYWRFKIKTEDNCSNVGDFSCEVGAYADATPPHVCIAVPDSGLTFGSWFPLKAVADSESHDVGDSVQLWYRLRPDIDNPIFDPGAWTPCNSVMDRPGDGIVFTDDVHCLEGVDYVGWVEMIVVACDEAGNCQDTTMAYDDACLVDDDVFRAGRFLFYWDTLAPGVQLVSVNGFPSPQSACGFDVEFGIMNEVVIDVEGATSADSFEVEVRGLCSGFECRIFHQDFVTMPLTIPVSVEGWPEGTRNLYVYVKDYDNDLTGNLQIDLCVPPPPPEDCIYISWPTEWMRIPCTGTSGYNCVPITARMYEYYQCEGVNFTEVRFQWSPNGIDTWETIEDVIGSGPTWSTCWDNTGEVEHGDTVYFRVIAHDEFYMADTSYRVMVFVDCEEPNVKLRLEELYYTCGNHDIPKISCAPLTLKAVLEDTLIDIDRIRFFFKRHSVPDIHEYWIPIDGWAEPAWSDNIWKYDWNEPCCVEDVGFGDGSSTPDGCMYPNDYWDIRVAARDIAGHYMYDYDNDGFFDDSTFNQAVYDSAGFTVFLDDEAPQPAFSMVADSLAGIYNVNPSEELGGNGNAYVKAFDPITVEISVLPSEDTCEVMKVEYYLCWPETCASVGTSTDPYHYPLTFDPVADGIIPSYEFEDGWWYGGIEAVLFDSLGNSSTDWVDLYILDVTPTQAIIVEPENDSYVWGDVELSVAALNFYEMCKVCYQYSQDGENWLPINEGEENSCSTEGEDFPIVWHTLNTVADGEYYLRAVATDCDNNEDDDPPTIRVTVANELPSVTILDPSICFRECPDDPVVTIGFVGDTVLVEATVDPGICPVTLVEFEYKNIFDYPGSPWHSIGIDSFSTAGVYDALWNTGTQWSPIVLDSAYHVRARAYNAAGRYKDSDPVMVSVDNTAPRVSIVSVNGETHPDGMDIALYDTLAIQVVAYDDDSDAGATRCYNSGVTMLGFCVTDGALLHDGEWPLSQLNWYTDFHDGDTLIYWNVSGLDIGTYYIYVLAKDCIGNWKWDEVEIRVYDHTPPLVTVGAFFYNPCTDQHFIYGYTCCASEDDYPVWAKFEYRMIDGADTSAWLGTGEADWYSEFDGQSTKHCFYEECTCCYRDFLQFVWDPSASLVEGVQYQGRILATDYWGNTSQDYPETYAPIVNFTYQGGVIVPQEGPLGALFFEKNFDVGRMHGMVMQNVSEDGLTPQVFGVYLPDWGCGDSEIECVWMQEELENTNYFGGSFEAGKIWDGGIGVFFSSVTQAEDGLPPATGEEQLYTYIISGDIMVVKVDRDLGTFTQYCTDEDVCVYVPGGAVSEDKHLVVWPEVMPPVSLDQPTWIPVGDDNGFATYVGFTTSFDQCFQNGRYATIKINYSSELEVPAKDLKVAWWDNGSGKWKTDDIFYPPDWGDYDYGFNTDDHTVTFAATCLNGPFAVVRVLERHCEGSIVVNMLQIKPYCNGYTNNMPTFTALITDEVEGTDAIDEYSIKFKLDLYEPGGLITIYDGGSWADGFGSFPHAGYDAISGIFKAGWDNDGTTGDTLDPGDHIATVTAQNTNIQTCTDTMQFTVDATEPEMWFADSVGAYVGANPHFCIHFTDTEAGVDKSSIWIDIYGDETDSPDPNDHDPIGTLRPDQLNWIDETTVCVDGTFEYSGGYLHVYVYGGPDCLCYDCQSPQFYYYECGISDCVGNHTDVFWQYFTVDADGPIIDDSTYITSLCDPVLQFKITDSLSGLLSVSVYEDCQPIEAIEQDVHNPDFWWYTPTQGTERVDIVATDNLGNVSVFSFDLPSDCGPPAVTFADEYVCKNPTITFWVTDPAGVDWTTVNAWITGCSEECYYPYSSLINYVDTQTGEVTLSGCNLDCGDNERVYLYVHSDTTSDWRDHISWGDARGPADLNGNYMPSYAKCTYVVDAVAPYIDVDTTKLDERPIRITIKDAKSGVDWETFEFYEDGEAMTVDYNTETGIITYDPESGGVEVEIRVTDISGCNLASKTFRVDYTGDDVLTFEDPHNYPNPFDPRAGHSNTTIDPGLSKDCYVTVKIYDFAGEFVTTIVSNQYVSTSKKLYWDGTTEGGTAVANGTYLCYIKAKDSDGATKTAVIKITVLKEDK